MSATVLWEPTEERVRRAAITRYAGWLEQTRGVRAATYDDLWRWSVDDLEGFWASIWEYFDVQASAAPERTLGSRAMPGAEWFPGARLSHPRHVFRDRDDDAVAIRHASELRELDEWTWGELRERTARIAGGLRALGVGPGDRVAAYLPNIPEAIASFLACASLGAVWSSCSPDFGARSVVDRFAQIEPKVLLAVDGYRYGGRDFDRREAVGAIAGEIGGLEHLVTLGYLDGSGWQPGFERPGEPLEFTDVPFDHPLWILYSSGTTGLPKPIVHGHGGILLEHLKKLHLHLDAQEGDRIFWFTTTGWMMWNFLVGVLLTPASIVLYEGNPGHPDLGALWDLAADAGVTCFGTSASYLATCMKAGIEPAAGRDLSALHSVGSTGSPLAARGLPVGLRPARRRHVAVLDERGHRRLHRVRRRRADVARVPRRAAGARAGRRGRVLGRGRAARTWAASASSSSPSRCPRCRSASGTTPTASGCAPATSRRTRASGATATGSRSPSAGRRSSAGARTRRSTAAACAWERARSTARCWRWTRSSTRSWSTSRARAPRAGCRCSSCCARARSSTTTSSLASAGASARTARRATCPTRSRQIAEVPRTLSGKVLEVPVKRILMGQAPDTAASRDSLANPRALDVFVELAGGDG